MKIDIFAHILPQKYLEALQEKATPQFQRAKTGFPVLYARPSLMDMDKRFRIMDKYPDYAQVLTLSAPAIEAVAEPKAAVELARIANDGMAELVAQYPDRFLAAVATLPMNDIEAALEEADRAIMDLGFRGILLYTPINGQPLDMPELMPLYEKMAKYNLPIWIHPRRDTVPDYANEGRSRYGVWSALGWPWETSVAMVRLVYSGVLEKYPNLKFITHHCGGMIPYFAGRLASGPDLGGTGSGQTHRHGLTRPILDYYRMFYNDTAVAGNTPALMCGYAFFGADHILFGTDTPYDNQLGDTGIRNTIRAIEEMDISASDRKKIYEENAKAMMRLPV